MPLLQFLSGVRNLYDHSKEKLRKVSQPIRSHFSLCLRETDESQSVDGVGNKKTKKEKKKRGATLRDFAPLPEGEPFPRT